MKPLDFTTKLKHFKLTCREGHGYFYNDPHSCLSSVITGSGVYHNGFRSDVTLGSVPSGLSAYVYEDRKWVSANYLAFIHKYLRFFPVTDRWVSGMINQSQYNGMHSSAYEEFTDF